MHPAECGTWVALVDLMRWTRLVIVAVIVCTPAISYAQEPQPAAPAETFAKAYASQGTFEAGGSIGTTIVPTVGIEVAVDIGITTIW